MNTQIISFAGILLGIALFIGLSFKGFNLLFNAVASSSVVIIMSSLPVLETLKETFMGSLSGFIKGYLLLFVLSAVFGKFMEDSGAVRRIALSLSKLTKKSEKNQKFWTVLLLPIFYFILSYVGISGFVVVFTVVAIGRELFEECDIPWSFYCYGSAGIFPAIILGGSLQPSNVIASEGFGVAPTAGFTLSIILLVVSWIVLSIQIKMDINKLGKTKEGFLPTGSHIKKLQIGEQRSESELPNIAVAAVPLIAPILAITLFKLDVLVSMSIAIVITILLMFKYIKNVKSTLTNGITAAGNPLIYVAAASGFAAVIKSTAGFTLVLGFLDGLPAILSALGLVTLMSGIAASSSSTLPTIMPYLVEKISEAGISSEVGARLVTASTWSYMTPHNAGVINAVSLTKLDFKKAAWIYFKSTCIPGICAMVAGILLAVTGIIG